MGVKGRNLWYVDIWRVKGGIWVYKIVEMDFLERYEESYGEVLYKI